MKDQISDSGFKKIECEYKDLDIYYQNNTCLIVINKFKDDKKASRVASNHIDKRLILELIQAFESNSTNNNITSIILTSAHKVVFSRGAKIELIKDATTEQCRKFISEAQNLTITIQNSPKTVIAALNGLTFGGGLELALACDYRIASTRENVALGLPEGHLGLLPAMGGTMNLMHLIGREKAYDMISKARMDISSDIALEIGLVDKLTEHNELIHKAFLLSSEKNLCKKVLPIKGKISKTSEEYQKEIYNYLNTVILPDPRDISIAPYPFVLLPFLFDRRDQNNLLETLRYELEVCTFLQKTDDCKEGISALIDERLPQFTGT